VQLIGDDEYFNDSFNDSKGIGHRSTPTMPDSHDFRSGSGQSFLKRLASEWIFLALVGYARKRWIPTPLLAGRTWLQKGDRLSGLTTAEF
jgi:hypothetical protein